MGDALRKEVFTFNRHGRSRSPEYAKAIRDATNKAWVLGADHFKAQFEATTGRRAMPLGRGGDRKSEHYRKVKDQ